jgi:2-iminoacetate synthase ThiH
MGNGSNHARNGADYREKAIEMLKERAGMGSGLGDKAEAVYDAYAKVFIKPSQLK